MSRTDQESFFAFPPWSTQRETTTQDQSRPFDMEPGTNFVHWINAQLSLAETKQKLSHLRSQWDIPTSGRSGEITFDRKQIGEDRVVCVVCDDINCQVTTCGGDMRSGEALEGRVLLAEEEESFGGIPNETFFNPGLLLPPPLETAAAAAETDAAAASEPSPESMRQQPCRIEDVRSLAYEEDDSMDLVDRIKLRRTRRKSLRLLDENYETIIGF